MDALIRISNINDFIFCPHSIYLHGIYESFEKQVYQDEPQTKGTHAHANIDDQRYSSAKRYLQAIPVYSEKLGIVGKIDVFDTRTGALIERKRQVKQIFDGYKYQLYAQYYALTEMGYIVKMLYIHSLIDNKRYPIPLPAGIEKKQFLKTVEAIKQYSVGAQQVDVVPTKCQMCIYRQLCAYSKC